MQLVIFFLRSILRTLIQIISMCILNVHILEVAREFFALWHSKWKQTSTKILIFQTFFSFVAETQNLLACCLKCQRLQCLRCAICIWFAHICICICIRNHAQKYREPFPARCFVDLFLSTKPFAFEWGLCIFNGKLYRTTRDEEWTKHVCVVQKWANSGSYPCALFRVFFCCSA